MILVTLKPRDREPAETHDPIAEFVADFAFDHCRQPTASEIDTEIRRWQDAAEAEARQADIEACERYCDDAQDHGEWPTAEERADWEAEQCQQ